MAGERRWWAQDWEGQASFYVSAEAAEQAAEGSLSDARDLASDDGWPEQEQMELIAWGEVHGRVVQTKLEEVESDDDGIDLHADYELQSTPPIDHGLDDERRALLQQFAELMRRHPPGYWRHFREDFRWETTRAAKDRQGG